MAVCTPLPVYGIYNFETSDRFSQIPLWPLRWFCRTPRRLKL